MAHPIEFRAMEQACADSTTRIGEAAKNDNLSWEEVTRIAANENERLMKIMKRAEQLAQKFVESSTDDAIQTGIFMFEQTKHLVDPDFIPDLVAGVNAFVARVHQQAEAGHSIPMDYMDPATRKEIFLVETYMGAKPPR